MENQINSGDQNTQQIGQNLIDKSSPVPEKPKIDYLAMAGVILVCFVVFGFGGYFLGKQSLVSQNYVNDRQNQVSSSSPPTLSAEASAEVGDWKTYTNNAYGFSFQYPPELRLSEDCNLWATGNFLTCLQSSDFSYIMSDPQQQIGGKPEVVSGGFGLFIKQDQTDYQSDISTLQESYKKSENVDAVTMISAIPALKVILKDDPGKVLWIMIHNKNVYSVLSPVSTQNYPIIDQILSTFKFTN